MKKHELSKYDFECLEEALRIALEVRMGTGSRLEQLKHLFAKAHTGWLEMEDE